MQLKIRSVEDFLSEELEPQDFVLEPWLPASGLAMLAGPRGGGKTMLGLACALCIASGSEFLGFRAPLQRTVLYVDGEMSSREMQERLQNLLTGLGLSPAQVADRLYLLCAVDQQHGIPSLNGPDGRLTIESALKRTKAECLILDNLSCLMNAAEENDAGSWKVIQEWLLSLRRRGITVVFLHHTGKLQVLESGKKWLEQRGTSKREDVLNTVMLIKPWKENGEDHFIDLVFTKHRGFTGETVNVKMSVSSDYCDFSIVEKPKKGARIPKEKIDEANAKRIMGERV